MPHDEPNLGAVLISPIDDAEPLRGYQAVANGQCGPRSAARNAEWIAPGRTVTVHDVSISTGWFYLGTKLPSNKQKNERCLVDPELPIIGARATRPVRSSFHKGYAEMNQTQRRGFLEWMANGRRQKSDPGFVLQFLYGVELRLFQEGVRDEMLDFHAEIARLCEMHSDHAELLCRARKLESCINGLILEPRRPDYRSCHNLDKQTLDVRVHLGRQKAGDVATRATDALLAASAQPNCWFKTPALRCHKEFEMLWDMRFAANPGIYTPLSAKKKIAARYYALSGTFTAKITGDFENLPDVLRDPQVVQKTKAVIRLFGACNDELDPYSRFLGRNPGLAGSPQASLLLPDDLWARLHGPAAVRLAGLLGGEPTRTRRLGDLLNEAGFGLDGASPKEVAFGLSRLSTAMESLGVGIEPDGARADAFPSLDAPAAVFRTGAAPTGANDGLAWRLALDVAVGCAGGESSQAARRAASKAIPATPGVDANRVSAYACVADVPASKVARTLKAAGELSKEWRQTTARCAISAVLAEGAATPTAVRALERVFSALGFPADDLYGALHSGEAPRAVDARPAAPDARSPTSAAPDRTRFGGADAAPEPPRNAPHGLVIDEGRLARARESTHAVAKILADVFVEDDRHASPAADPVAPVAESHDGETAFPGLDQAHAALLSGLLDAETMAPAAFEAMARGLKLLPSGALDRINEWGYDRFDDLLVEEGEFLTVAEHLRPELTGPVPNSPF